MWDPAADGVLRLPSGRLVRGRALRRPLPPGAQPTFALYLLGRRPPPVPWEARWVRWRDFRLPDSTEQALDALREAHTRAASERVEIASGILQIYTRTPTLTAMTAAGLDYVSGGRFTFTSRATGVSSTSPARSIGPFSETE